MTAVYRVVVVRSTNDSHFDYYFRFEFQGENLATQSKPSIGIVIREERARKYSTAKEYWEEHRDILDVSYPHYSAVEAQKKFPDVRLTISIAKTLKMDLRLLCHIWAKDQMPDAETKAFFEPIPGKEAQGFPPAVKAGLDEFYVFTEKQIPALSANPHIWDILSFIVAFSKNQPTEAQITAALSLPRATVTDAIDWLRNEGLVYSERGHLKTKRNFFHLPNTIDFKAIRDRNFQRVSEDLLRKIPSEDLKQKEAYRITFSRRLTRLQAKEISEHIDSLVGHVGNLDVHGTDFYSLTIAFGSRAKLNVKDADRDARMTSREVEAKL